MAQAVSHPIPPYPNVRGNPFPIMQPPKRQRLTSYMPAEIIKECACTGVRWCSRCLDAGLRRRRKMDDPVAMPPLLANPRSSWGITDLDQSIVTNGTTIHAFDLATQSAPTCPEFRGLIVVENFLSETEAHSLLATIDQAPFASSQSGKDKQHYGAKVNFNKRRMSVAGFPGLPDYAHDLVVRMRERLGTPIRGSENKNAESALEAFLPTDVFVLRYAPELASNLDLHLDDTFAYGEMILDVSLESDSILTFFRGRPGSEVDRHEATEFDPSCVRVPLPAGSLAILFGPARYAWEHGILACDISARRTSITIRTMGDSLKETESGKRLLELCALPESTPRRASDTAA